MEKMRRMIGILVIVLMTALFVRTVYADEAKLAENINPKDRWRMVDNCGKS